MTQRIDYLRFYWVEEYLLMTGRRFRKTGRLDPADFYMLLILKANRAKNYARDRLKRRAGSFRAAVSAIARELHGTPDRKSRLEVLMRRWGFKLPTASAILTILYPDEFTFYDWRVCAEVSEEYRPYSTFSEELWCRYERFRAAVINATPARLSLRDKDRFLIGRSVRKEVERDCMA